MPSSCATTWRRQVDSPRPTWNTTSRPSACAATPWARGPSWRCEPAASPPSPRAEGSKEMRPMDSPLRFEPFLRPMVWGGRRLETLLHKPLPSGAAYGESWEVSDHPLHRSVVAARGAARRSLRDLMEYQREGLLGRA